MTSNINLYDASLKTRRDFLAPMPMFAMLSAAMICMAAAIGWARGDVTRLTPIAVQGAAALQTRQAALQVAGEAAAKRPDTGIQTEVAAAQRILMQRRAALQTLAASPIDRDGGFVERLEALARQSVDGLWLTSMVLRQDDVVLKGRALQPQLIPVYVQRLDQEPSLQGHAFRALDIIRPVDKAARVASAATGDVDASAGAARSTFVEFTLSGSGAGQAAIDTEARP